MRSFAWAIAAMGALLAFAGAWMLLQPTPSGNDAFAFALVGSGLLFAYVAAALAFEPRWWHWWIPAAWIGLDIAALFLAYKDTFALELAYFGPVELALQLAIHALIAPFEIALGFLIGFVEPQAWIVVLACVTVALLGAELLRRRMWPRAAREAREQGAEGA